MLYSIYSGVTTAYPIEDRIAAIRSVGFDAVCLDFEAELAATETSWDNQVRLCEKYGLPIENVHLTGAGMTSVWSEDAAGDAVIDRLVKELSDMASLGIRVGIAHVTWGHDRPAGSFALGLSRYLRAAEAAEKYGVYLALENSVYPEYVRYLLDNINSKHVGFCWDSGHENAFSPGEDFLDAYADRLLAMHIHDNDGVHDLHAMPFTGTVNWEHAVRGLKRSPLFSRMLTLECGIGTYGLEDGFAAALESAKRLHQLSLCVDTTGGRCEEHT